jgi:D-alanyl-D-alanine carboxypeptidase/D-alanyl-D-alanine-endopeptidase (penicillin-binding protein 4)
VTPLRRSVAVVLALLVLTSVVVAGLGLTGRLPSGVTGAADPAPSAVQPLDPPAAEAPPVLTVEEGPPGAPPQLPEAALDAVLTSGALGPEPGAVVLDVTSGATLLDRTGDAPRTPASVAKLATGAAALHVLGPDHRLETRVVEGEAPGEVVLVGGGDATLTSRRPRADDYPRTASLVELADATAAALRGAGESGVTVRVDDSLFSGPAVSPDWPASYVGSGEVAPVSALSVDAGRVRPSENERVADPAVAAGTELARLLAARGVSVEGEVSRAPAPAGATALASVSSPPVAALVERMLSASDDDLAESLLRLVAVSRGRPGSFAEGGAVVVESLAGLGVATDGVVLRDGSGLARTSAIPPRTLAGLLGRAADGSVPGLGHLVTGLPVAGFSGTLADRFATGQAGRAAGLVRAKTGTLTGVSTLAGVTSLDGRPVVFVVMSDQVPGDTLAARAALDRFAATLAAAR